MGFVQMLFRITNINHQRFWIVKLSLCTGTEQYTPLEPYQKQQTQYHVDRQGC
jgi:hypothetical protein